VLYKELYIIEYTEFIRLTWLADRSSVNLYLLMLLKHCLQLGFSFLIMYVHYSAFQCELSNSVM